MELDCEPRAREHSSPRGFEGDKASVPEVRTLVAAALALGELLSLCSHGKVVSRQSLMAPSQLWS